MGFQVFKAKNVDEAITLAAGFQRKGDYDWFRGQVQPWPPYSSTFRIKLRSEQEWQETCLPRILRFCAWLKITPGLEQILEDRDAVFAIAQHHGIPTDYIDFTTDPAVAGFFASADPETSGESCIYCLNTRDLKNVWETIVEVQPECEELLDLVVPKVPNLWRLEAQKGVFLFCPSNWDVHYPLDRIVFPHTGYPSSPTKSDIYPDIKSPLEILLDQYFMNETLLTGGRAFRQFFEEVRKVNPDAHWVEAEPPPPDNLRPDYLAGGTIPKLGSWQDQQHRAWLEVPAETIAGVRGAEVRLHVEGDRPPQMVRETVAAGVRRLLDAKPELRGKSVNWRLEGLPATSAQRERLSVALHRLWDGMRIHPYEDRQIALAAGTCAALLMAGFPGNGPAEDQKLASLVIGENLTVEFSSADGAYSRGQAAQADLLAAVRSDVADHIEETHRARAGEIKFLLQVILAPDRLFEFDRLVELFAAQLIPTQVLRDEKVVYFSPARIERFGLP